MVFAKPRAASLRPGSTFPGIGGAASTMSRGGTTSQSWQPSERRAATSAPQKVLAMGGLLEVVRSECGGCDNMAQNPTSTPKKKLRLGGYGARSTKRPTFWLPKLLTSGSMPQ